jgi:formylglycine-generating enzyme required for sulfatase activity
VAEWLALAGCIDQRFPWGNAPPTRAHANLKFDTDSRLKPVGTFLAGCSPAGVYDCCGGVHEIVREMPHERFVSDQRFAAAFRLAGGSYWTEPVGLTCQRLRHLSVRERTTGHPSTVGIRLILYREADESARWASLREFRKHRQARGR